MRGALPIVRVDVFTDRPFSGNPAAALLDADGLSDLEMQQVAAEMSVAGTAFVSASTGGHADLKLRMFTPRREVTYSGHTSVAAVHALLELERLGDGPVAFETLAGLLQAEVEPRSGAGPIVWLEPPLPGCVPFAGPLPEILAALRLSPAGLGPWAAPALTPEKDLLLPAADLSTLRGLAPDMGRISEVGGEAGLRGLCVVSLETVEPGSRTHSRFFAPHYGIPEDVVTGSVHSGLGVWLLEAGQLVLTAGRASFTAEQGDGLGRPGRLLVDIVAAGGRPTRVRVGGRAVTVLSGSLRIG